MIMKTLSPNAQYTIGMLLWMTLYAGALILSVTWLRMQQPTGLLLYVLAVLPAFPVGGSIWVVLRHIDRVDEYIRAMLTRRFITATGLTLFACTAWGFLENNAGAHEFSLYLVYPFFWMMFAVASIFDKLFGKAR